MYRLQRLVSRLAIALVLVAGSLGATASPIRAQQPPAATPAPAGAAVLVGLRSGISLHATAQGVSASDGALARAVSALGVRSADSVFHGVSGRGLVSVAGLAGPIDLRAVYKLRLPAGANVAAALDTMRSNPAVVYAEPDGLAHLVTAPNDPLFAQQWGLAQIGAPTAWNTVTGSPSVVIAIIDSGLDTTHPDLAGQLWTNPGEIAGNGIDDDNDGYVDDIHGWNILDNNSDLGDTSGHGTEVAGIAAAATNNGAGIAGVCWACKLMVVKVAQPSGVANYSDIAAGVNYAALKGARVINLSLGGNSDSITLRAAVTAAAETAVVVGGAGNDNSSAPFYPAAYPEALAVAGTTAADTKVADSNYGPWVSVSAPGEAITTTFSGGNYGASSGTSLAAPFASGLAGLLFSQHPDWSAAQVRAQIIHTAHNIDALNPSYAGQLGSGRLDAASAVTTTPEPLLQYGGYAANGQANVALTAGATLTLAVSLHNDWGAAGSVSATLTSGDSHVTVTKANANWGTLGSGQTVTNSGDPFQVSVQAGAFGLNIPFTLNVLADGSPTTLHFTATTQSVVQTVGGHITSDRVWTNDRVWQVTGNIFVDMGITLTIEPGTVVEFETAKALQVNGTLIAKGTTDRPIRFTSAQPDPAPGDWGPTSNYFSGGIEFTSSSQPATLAPDGSYLGGSVIAHSIIEYGSSLFLDHAGPLIEGNVFQFNGGLTTLVTQYDPASGAPVVRYNRIAFNSSSDDAVAVWYSANAQFLHNLVAENASGLVLLGSNATVLSNTITADGGRWCGPNIRAAICVNDMAPGLAFHGNNIFDNATPYAASVQIIPSQVMTVTDNYWGTSSSTDVAAQIYDSADDISYGTLIYEPFRSEANPEAPAILSNVTFTPISPVGIQHVTFNLTFSAPMDQSLNPTVTFGSASPYDTYPIVDNAQWLDATHWQATYDVTSLVPRGAYTLSVSGAQGVDGMVIPTDTRYGFTVDYAGTVTDKTPPPAPWVFADSASGNPGYVTARWSATDPNSAIIHYRYAIGSAPGAVDVVNWTTLDATTVSRSGLGLVNGQHYWVSVQAQNQGGLWSPVGASQFIAGALNPRIFTPIIRR